MSCGVGCRPGSDLAWPWLWRRPAAVAPIRPLTWEPPYAAGAALKKDKKKKKEEEEKKKWDTCEGARREEPDKHKWAPSLLRKHHPTTWCIVLNTHPQGSPDVRKGAKRALVRKGCRMYAAARTPSLSPEERGSQAPLLHLSLLKVCLQDPPAS